MFLWLRQVVAARMLRVSFPALAGLAYLWRRLLFRTTVIAITGSLGKTTTKELLADILPAAGSTFHSLRNQNARRLLILNILRIRPWHRYAVIETASGKPGALDRASRILRPDVVVLVCIASAHIRSFGTLEKLAEEKVSLTRFMRPGGTLVLNGDEPRFESLLAARSWANAGRVFRFGSTPGCDLAATEVEDTWPERLRLVATTRNEACPVATRLVGRANLQAVMAALLTAQALGVPLSTAAQKVSQTPPFPVRMQPVEIPPGITFLRDEYNGTRESFEAAFDTLARARAERKVLIAGDFSDSKLTIRRRLQALGREAAGIFDVAVFIGESAHHSEKAWIAVRESNESVRAFFSPEEAVPFLIGQLKKGDLVLLKGRSHERLSRTLYGLVGEPRCRKPRCELTIECDFCWELGVPAEDRAKIRTL